MEQWDQDFVDLVARGHITLTSDDAALGRLSRKADKQDCQVLVRVLGSDRYGSSRSLSHLGTGGFRLTRWPF